MRQPGTTQHAAKEQGNDNDDEEDDDDDDKSGVVGESTTCETPPICGVCSTARHAGAYGGRHGQDRDEGLVVQTTLLIWLRRLAEALPTAAFQGIRARTPSTPEMRKLNIADWTATHLYNKEGAKRKCNAI